MASRRIVPLLLRPARLGQLSRQPGILTSPRKPTAHALLATKTLPSSAIRWYSKTNNPQPQSKIWFFEDVQKAVQDKQSKVVIVDTREPSELQASGRIPGAVNIPITSAPDSFHVRDDDFEDRFGYARPPKDAEVVFYCKAGVRSRAAAQLARDAGWLKIGEYPGSWNEWAERGGQVDKGK